MKFIVALILSASVALGMDVAGIGDSIMAGHCLSLSPQTFLSAIENGWVESGDTNMSPMHVLHGYSGGSLSTTNLGHGSYTWQNLWLDVKQYIPTGTRVVVVHCGINDIMTSQSWATTLVYMDALKGYVNGLGAKFVIEDIFPDAGTSDAQALIIRTWNTYYHTWASTNGSYSIIDHDAMGQIRVSTGFLDDMNTAYYCHSGSDSVHCNTNGVMVMTINIFNTVNGILNPVTVNVGTVNAGTLKGP